jgi:hypothetical protein
VVVALPLAPVAPRHRPHWTSTFYWTPHCWQHRWLACKLCTLSLTRVTPIRWCARTSHGSRPSATCGYIILFTTLPFSSLCHCVHKHIAQAFVCSQHPASRLHQVLLAEAHCSHALHSRIRCDHMPPCALRVCSHHACGARNCAPTLHARAPCHFEVPAFC